MFYITKVLISAMLVVIISEVAKINNALAGLINALPLISLLSLFWLYFETKDTQTIANLSYNTLWFVLPTLPLFLALPYFLKRDLGFYASLSLSIVIMLVCYLSC
ncbi:MAG: DUF3147 family protein [Alphaproteobacteria bacterium]|jgi:uncharacterized membrane protein (GlpM family)|nr:DUF3147 family protein [Alphaproteobacteria bacterium]